MSSFDFILPSNVAADSYPENTPSNYTTPLINPIQCEGQWEVGVKNVFYSSRLGNDTEMAHINLKHKQKKMVYVNDLYPVKYILTKDGKWRYDYVPIPLMKPFTVENVVNTMNGMNSKLVERGSLFVYSLTPTDSIHYHSPNKSLIVRFPNATGKLLGYQYTVFGKPGTLTVPQLQKNVSNDNYSMMIFDPNVVAIHAVVIIKKSNEDFLSREELIKRWNDNVRSKIKSKLEFKSNKVVISLYNHKSAIMFNTYFEKVISQEQILMGHGEFWGNHHYGPRRDLPNPGEGEWKITIYKDDMKKTLSVTHHWLDYELYLRNITISDLLTSLSTNLTKLLQSNTKDKSEIIFSLDNNLTKMILPPDTTITFSNNLRKTLGFKQCEMSGIEHISTNLPITRDRQEQDMLIYTDLCDPVQYGNEKRRILQYFIHAKQDKELLIEKWFEPIVYQPLMKQYIDKITLQILSRDMVPQVMRDKTIVTLHFRKR